MKNEKLEEERSQLLYFDISALNALQQWLYKRCVQNEIHHNIQKMWNKITNMFVVIYFFILSC